MDTRIVERPVFRLIGHAVRAPLIDEGVNPHIQALVTGPDATGATELTYLHGVAVAETSPVPDGLHAIDVPAGTWAVFRTSGPYPAALQETWAATAATVTTVARLHRGVSPRVAQGLRTGRRVVDVHVHGLVDL